MNFFKKSFQSLFNRDITATLVPKVRIIGDLPYKIVYTYDLLSVLNNCLPSILYKKVEISGNQIKAYNVYEVCDVAKIPPDNYACYKFLASCYAVLIDNTYYGVVIGDNKLWSCHNTTHRRVMANYIDVILRISQKWIYTLPFDYNSADLSLNERFLLRTELNSNQIPLNREVVLTFIASSYPYALPKSRRITPRIEVWIAFSGGNYPAALACAKKNFNV